MQNINQQAENMDSTHLSREELEAAVLGISDADILRVSQIANSYTGSHEMEADDLVQEAIMRTLAGDRKTCPRDLPIVYFLAGVIKSIAHEEREKNKRKKNDEDSYQATLKQFNDEDCSTENDVLEQQLYNELEAIYEEDEEILLLILYLQEGESSSEIQKNEGWSETHYNSIRRRMRRKWNAHREQEKIS